MSQPTPYTPTTDFSQQEANNASGRSTVNTAALDAELVNIETTLDELCGNLELIQRDDGRLGDLTVEIHTISPEVLNLMGGFALRGLWAPATAYAVKDIASEGAYTYVCSIAHTSGGAFDGQYWKQFGFTAGADAAQAAAAAQVSAANALVSETNAAASASSASSSAGTATTQASSAATSAGIATTQASAASSSAVNAANSAAASAASAASIAYPIPVASGGTGSTSASAARTALGAIGAGDTATLTNKTLAAATNVIEARSGPDGSQFSHRNKIINGNFAINQRVYVAGAAVGAGLYGHDRWKMAASADTYTFSTVNNKTTVTIPSGKVLQQVIEGLNLQTGTYILSWEGTAQGKIGAGALSASGVTGSITGGTNTTIEFGPGTVANIQLEAGSVATPFEHRPIGVELALCQRYYYRSAVGNNTGSYAVGLCDVANNAAVAFSVPVRMRAGPTLTWNSLKTYDATAAAAVSAVNITGLSDVDTFLLAVTTSGMTVGRPILLQGNSSNSYIALSAEL
jgi:hypothetical protein